MRESNECERSSIYKDNHNETKNKRELDMTSHQLSYYLATKSFDKITILSYRIDGCVWYPDNLIWKKITQINYRKWLFLIVETFISHSGK